MTGSVIVVDGPEKAGKTTLIRSIEQELTARGVPVMVRKQSGMAVPSDAIYAGMLAEDISWAVSSGGVAVWDRSWASEYVYGTLLGQDRRLVSDPWLGEWLHGRAVQSVGLRVIVRGPSPEVLQSRRDRTDLPVDPAAEQELYAAYARRFNWELLCDLPPVESLEFHRVVERVIRRAAQVGSSSPHVLPPPAYCGPTPARVVFIGEARSVDRHSMPGMWLPFTSRYTTQFGRLLGDRALECGWTNVRDCSPQALREAKCLVSCGKIAQQWVQFYVDNRQQMVLLNLPHPSYLYRYNNERTRRQRVEVEELMRKLRDSLVD